MVRTLSPLPPGTLGKPVVGELRAWARDPVGFLWERYHRYGRIFKTNLGARHDGPVIFMIGPEANRFILHDRRDAFSWGKAAPQYLRVMFGDEPMAMKDGDPFLRLRTTIVPAFHPETLGRSFEFMKERAAAHLKNWTTEESITCFSAVRALMYEVTCQWLMGTPARAEDRGRLEHLWHTFTDVPEGRRDLPRAPDQQRWTQPFNQAEEVRARVSARFQLERYLKRVIAERRQQPTLDVISLMSQARDKQGLPLNDSEIVAQTMMLLAAGSDTTSAMTTWLFYELGRHPRVRAALREELRAVVGGAPLKWEHLRQLPYLRCVLKEVERMHSPTVGGVRIAVEPFEFDGYRVPAGWKVRDCAVLTHFLPEVFAEPEKFAPERFAPPREEDKRTPFSLIGFGAGPRHCTGQELAIAFMQTVAIEAVRNFDWTILPDQDLTPVLDRVFKPRSRLKLKVSARPEDDVAVPAAQNWQEMRRAMRLRAFRRGRLMGL